MMLISSIFTFFIIEQAFMRIKTVIFAFKLKTFGMKDLNRIKVVLVEKKRTAKWLAEQLGRNPATVSKWCTNSSQPDLHTLDRVAELLSCEIRDLIV